MDEAQHCNRVVIINEGKIVAGGTPAAIIRDVFPEKPDADLNDAFLKLMSRGAH
jgi:ABC-2 type transport system ATP-binding protein